MLLNAAENQGGYAEYFDTLPGRLLATATASDSIVTSLRNETFPAELWSTFSDAWARFGDHHSSHRTGIRSPLAL
ncbi:MAG UNVERIFIED_CONTAM: hypothetical protein LVR18_14450 [Planctomycetaceae bacterium]